MVALHASRVLVLVGSAVAFAGCGADEEIALVPVEPAAGGAGGSSGAAGTGGTGGAGCAQCSGDRPFCDSSSGRCVACLLDTHCGGEQACDRVNGECATACSTASACSSGDRALCDTARGICVECAADGDCASSGDSPYCASGRCVQCRSNTDCVDPQKRYCDRGECHQCLSDAHCSAGEICDPNELQCRE